jgi:hypothetical protein
VLGAGTVPTELPPPPPPQPTRAVTKTNKVHKKILENFITRIPPLFSICIIFNAEDYFGQVFVAIIFFNGEKP